MTNRLAQLFARYLASALTALAGALGLSADAGDTQSLALALATAVVAIVLYLIDLLIHKAETGGVTKPAGTSKGAILLACLLLPLSACAGVPGSIVVGHVDAVSPDHLARLEAAAEDPPRVIPASSAEVATYRANWSALREAGESAKGGAD